MFVYLITGGGLRPFPRSNLKDILKEGSPDPIFGVYWAARSFDDRSFFVVGQFPTHDALREKTNWSMSPPSLPSHFERFDGVWKLGRSGMWEWVAGVFRAMPSEVASALDINPG